MTTSGFLNASKPISRRLLCVQPLGGFGGVISGIAINNAMPTTRAVQRKVAAKPMRSNSLANHTGKIVPPNHY